MKARIMLFALTEFESSFLIVVISVTVKPQVAIFFAKPSKDEPVGFFLVFSAIQAAVLLKHRRDMCLVMAQADTSTRCPSSVLWHNDVFSVTNSSQCLSCGDYV